MDDIGSVYDTELTSRLFLGTARYPSLAVLQAAIKKSETEVVTTSLRRQNPSQKGGKSFWNKLQQLDCWVLPNTAGCHTANEATTLAQMSREIFQTDWIKLEVTGDEYNLQPDPFELVVAADQLVKLGFKVFAYTTEDLVLCSRLRDVGCEVIMPWGAPIGTGKGILNRYALETLRNRLPEVSLVLDAGVGQPSHVAQAMELGFAGVLLNTAMATADDPAQMAEAMKYATLAGRKAYLAGPMAESGTANPSTPNVDLPFWQNRQQN